MTPDIFLSYTREDQATAQRFAEAFEAQGFKVWWDVTLRSGEAYDQVTEEALRTAKAVVVLWSKKSVVSRWVRAEATLADRNRTLVPATIEPCQRPIMFELTQTADLCRWTGDAKDPAWRGFLADVRRFVGAGAEPPPPAAPSPQATSKPLSRAARPSIALLPFLNRSGRPEDDSFADCMADDLTAALSGGFWTKVVAAGAVAQAYRAGARDLRQIGRELGARYLTEGTIRRASDHLRVSVQLVEAENGDVLWAEKFDRPLADLSALQEALVAEIAAHLGVQVERAEIESAVDKLGDGGGREAALRAYFTSTGYPTRSGYAASAAELKRAVQANPNDGAAHAFLAAQQAQLLHHSGGDDPALEREITENMRKARALDPNNPAVLMWVGGALIGLRRLDEALPLAERGAALQPNFESTRFILGAILARLGRADEAIAELDAGDRLSPNSSSWLYLSALNRSLALFLAGRLPQAIEAAERVLPVLSGPELLIQNALCLAKADQRDRARNALRRLHDTDPNMSRTLVEQLVRGLYCACPPAQIEEYATIVRKLWDDASSEANSP
jgi:TolB-like protein/Tfp pilus assembly protein PilF